MPSIDGHFRAHIDVLLSGSFNGSCFKPLQVKDFQTSAPAIFCEEDVSDHFKLHIPYAGQTLVWEVRFDSNCPEQAPDFLFDDDAFTSFLTVDVLCDRVPSLETWDTGDPSCLSTVVQQLLNLYTIYQLKRLEKDGSSLGDECSKLVQEFDLTEDQIQVLSGDFPTLHYYGGSTRPPQGTVSVMFLHLEKLLAIENLPDMYSQMALQVNLREYSANNVIFHINPVLAKILGDVGELEVPNHSKSEELAVYFRNFLQVLRKTLSQVSNSYEKRQEFHLALFYELTSVDDMLVVPLENDIPHFTSSSYQIECDDYPVTLVLQTPTNGMGDMKVSLRTLTGGVRDIDVAQSWDIQKVISAVLNELMDLKEEQMEP